ncbi:hypothetical protein ACM66B_002368 [Microbotryomycetes sp. NB124-2]
MSSFKTTVRQQLSLNAQNIVNRRRNGATDAMDEQDVLNMVNAAMHQATGQRTASEGTQSDDTMLPQWLKDSRRTIVDSALEQMALSLNPDPATDDEQVAFGIMTDVLDVILTFAEQGYADDTCPLNVITLLMDQQTVEGCVHLFRWIESRVDRVTKGMQPLRGKGPVLLRLSNELLRRLPKTKQEHVVFSGQVLMFLNSVFPLGEKSGVNLRGNFNTGKVTVFDEAESGSDKKRQVQQKGVQDDEADQPDFYHAFWSLQRYFSNPALLFDNATTVRSLKELQTGMNKTLTAFAEATKQERRLAGSSKAGGKRKAETDQDIENSLEQYFFPKYLTSRNLLELEIADTSFRRQVLFQALILFQYMLSFVPAERERLRQRTTNLSALPNYVLAPESEKWVRELRAKSLAELDAMEGGRRFRQTIELISRREQNWINWKLKSCFSFEKPPLAAADRSEVARSKLKLMGRRPKSYMHALGNANLSRTWQRNTTSLDEFEPELIDDEFDSLYRQWKMSTKAVQMRKAALEQAKAASASSKAFELEAEIEQLEIKAKAIQWRAVRALARTNMAILNKSGSADLDVILATMEEQKRLQEEKEAKETAQRDAPADAAAVDGGRPSEVEQEMAATNVGEQSEGATVSEESAPAVDTAEVAEDGPEDNADGAAPSSDVNGQAQTVMDDVTAPDSKVEALPTSPSGKRKHADANDDVEMEEGAATNKRVKVEDA